ncbi:MAG: hypothetical protein JW902_07090 [Syntrophaceae bacterium]|nr:hypothetical protein [Syntrophaceae bacterium]
MRLNENSFTTGQDEIASFEGYYLPNTLTATHLDPNDLLEMDIRNWWAKRRMDALLRKSSITTEPIDEAATPAESESPFDEIIDRLGDDEKINEIVKFLNQTTIAFPKRLAERIQFLFEASKEEYPDEVAILPESLKNFVSFLQTEPNLKYPDVVLSPDKNICAQWRTAPNRHFSVEFLPTGDARFVIFSPDPKQPDKINRISGIVSLDSLMRTAQPHGVRSWCAQ